MTVLWKRPGCWLAAAGLVAILAAVAVYVARWVERDLFSPYRGFPGDSVEVRVEPGTGAGTILRQLEQAGVLADARLARLYLVHYLDDPPLQAGRYRFSEAASGPRVLEMLIRGQVVTRSVTLIEGMTLEETATLLADEGFGDRSALVAAMRDPEPIRDLDPVAPDLEGYLFPDTYRFADGAAERDVVAKLVQTFRQRFASEVEPYRGELSVRDLVTLASIVEKEARLDEERPLIAAVYRNRLDRGMGLYADPTVIYALKLLGRWDGNIRRRDLELDSPYNTYRYRGLPPGPIASPGAASLVAAARPADVPHLYFVSRNDGSHVFSDTLAEHNRAVDRWQRRGRRGR